MKLKTLKYQKCFNLGNFENEVIGIEIEVENGEKAEHVLNLAQKFVEAKGNPLCLYKKQLEHYETILQRKNSHTFGEVTEAEEWIEKNKQFEDDLPF